MEENSKKVIHTKSEQDGVAYLLGLGIKEVSDKTFINQENLKALLEKDFSTINKTKALGFIQILEREFDVDLQGLKSEYLQHAHSVKPVAEVIEKKEEDTREREKEPEVTYRHEREKKRSLMPYLLLAGALLLVAWIFFANPPQKAKEVVRTPKIETDTLEIEAKKKKVKENLLAVDKNDEKEVSVGEEVDLDKVVKEMFQSDNTTNAPKEQQASTQTESPKSAESAEKSAHNSTLENVLASLKSVKRDADETPISADNTMPTPRTMAKNRSQTTQKPPEEERMALIEDTQTSANAPIKKVKSPAPKPKKSVKSAKSTGAAGFFIEPIKKAWVGVVYLDTMQKRDFLINSILKLNTKRDQVILVGHKDFKIYYNNTLRPFKSRKMVRFLYKNGRLSELTRAQYNQYLGDMRW